MTEDQEVIRVQHVTKVYKLYRSRQDRLQEWLIPFAKKRHTEHFALRDISFTVQKGEVIGLIGKNGSGKSTLLKILAGVVTQNKGLVECKGNVTALLELGAGFNSELTGIENIYYLGAIQGVSKTEMQKKIDEILTFAELGDYAWQPVKNYSSGMYVRLAFSLSIHIDPEVLIIDEALSVGDVRFQQKCFRKIRQFKEQGKTIIFCSHSMQAVRDFCTKVIWIHDGVIQEIGQPDMVTEHYNLFMTTHKHLSTQKQNEFVKKDLSSIQHIPAQLAHLPWVDISETEQFGIRVANIEAISVQDGDRNPLSFTQGGTDITISMLINAQSDLPVFSIQISLNNSVGSKIANIVSELHGQSFSIGSGKQQLIKIRFSLPDLPNGQYSLGVGIKSIKGDTWEVQHFIHDALFFHLHTDDPRFHANATMVIREVKFSHREI